MSNGEIYARKIEGVRSYATAKEFGYTDYTGLNVLETPNHEHYFIDTESKSFFDDMPEHSLDSLLCSFLMGRFKLIHNITEFKIPLTISVVDEHL